mmetsp:Transcript_4356/g.8761  ORF Transcript_4356/g.8761 Transcript_4356/m.8761 type:complete len:84 (-) Transcript_4356:1466-1717(-)
MIASFSWSIFLSLVLVQYGEPLGVVPLFGMDILPFGGKPNGFMLKNKLSAGARTWYFSCETPSELELWINALREAKKVALIGQ